MKDNVDICIAFFLFLPNFMMSWLSGDLESFLALLVAWRFREFSCSVYIDKVILVNFSQ